MLRSLLTFLPRFVSHSRNNLKIFLVNKVVIIGHANLQGHSCFSDLSGRYGLEE